MGKPLTKEKTLSLLKDKLDGKNYYSFADLEKMTGYTSRHLKRLSKELNKKDIDTMLIHGNSSRTPSIAASDQEKDYIIKFKSQYPKITIAHFKDIYDEDIIDNPDKKDDVIKYNLKKRSKSFFRQMYIDNGWKSPIKRKSYTSDYPIHHLRDAMPKRGMLIQIDGTPHDWFDNGEKHCLHLAIDDASKEIIAGWFTKNECIYGYLKVIEIMIREYGLPLAMYSDKHSIFKSTDEINGETRFQAIMKHLGIETILANSSQAKGRVERYNSTIQNRLVVDIKRYKIKDYDELNVWFNSTYKHYLNKKFANVPLDPNDEFVKVDEDFDYIDNLSIKVERRIQNGDLFSYENCYFSPLNEETGEILHITTGVKVNVLHDIINKKLYIKRYDKLIPCTFIKETRLKDIVNNKKELTSRVSDYIEKGRNT